MCICVYNVCVFMCTYNIYDLVWLAFFPQAYNTMEDDSM